MPSLKDILQVLEEKLDDLKRDTKFCINNCDIHHKNNEYEILQQLQNILDSSYQDGKECIKETNKVRNLIKTAQQRCSEVDEMLKDLGLNPDEFDAAKTSSTSGNCPSSSHSFTEADLKHCGGDDDSQENKENLKY